MTSHRSPNSNGHSGGKGQDQTRMPLNEQPIGAFDVLSAQIQALRQDIDYVREQVAQLQEIVLRGRARER